MGGVELSRVAIDTTLGSRLSERWGPSAAIEEYSSETGSCLMTARAGDEHGANRPVRNRGAFAGAGFFNCW